ncbi:glycoside hydrolase family 73 protein [Lederbergia sp. NSJ-179]|uniref:glycoside hydrolase family 73 protein n=1 Tax=Lederbergia sp. NSJ-179 TaxID=2931402 RepID=UPI001FD36A9C|nr:glycoside hydrolase family 73 protein [Lederbergia sp. NSJ-179]MCJ7839990.1 glycoside hydrolase family 73 protein [Lederbergia sp. NSJ-179]
MSTANFLNSIKPGALQLWSKFGILPSVAAGQAALESAWGKSGLAVNYNNLFGIKGSYQGNSAMLNTWEVYGGQRYDIKAGFRAYPNWSTSILDYGVFLTVNQRYKAAINVSDYKKQITAIHKAGYATDPQYANKVISIIENYGLANWDKEVLNKKESPKKETTSADTYRVETTLNGYKTAADAKARKNKAGAVKAGSYYVFNRSGGMVNVTTKAGVLGSWINPVDNKKAATLKVGQKVKIKSSAKKYSRSTVTIPAKYKNKSYTIQQVANDDVLIKELYSWVKKSDLQ